MSGRLDDRLVARLLGIGATAVVMVATIVVVGPMLPPTATAPADGAMVVRSAASPIAAEADVFRTTPRAMAAGDDRRETAHPRSISMFQRLRAYPGAPPRIPHGLTTDELRDGRCNTCHERGGFVARFMAYAPLTPHPDWSLCLQCHVPDDRLVGIPAAAGAGEAVCLQCHVMDGAPPRFVELDWPAPRWPDIGRAALPGAPPAIPHELHYRGNCVACHAGAAAVEEIRTTHPERANCRQCHVAVAAETEFVRPPSPAGAGGGAP